MKIADNPPDIIFITLKLFLNLKQILLKKQDEIFQVLMYSWILTQTFMILDPSSCRGIIIYVSNKINATELSFDTQFKENLWISIPMTPWLLVVFIEVLQQNWVLVLNPYVLGVVTESCSHLLICGDFNYANINWINNIGHTNNSCA